MPYFSLAASINIENVQVREPFKPGAPLTIYLDIANNTDQLDYLIGAQMVTKANINKSIIEKGIAKTIQINRLAIPANTKVSMSPLGIYVVSYDYQNNNKLQLFFENSGEVIINISSE